MLKLNVDSLEAVDEPLRALYVEKDGKFALAVEGIEDTGGLKTALSSERKRAADLEKQTKAWKSIGKTPDEIAELIEAQEQRTLTEAERKGEWEKLRSQMNEKHAEERAKDAEKFLTLRQKHIAKIVDAEAVSAIAAAKGDTELLLPFVQRFVKVDDEFNVQVVDAKGDPRVNGKGEPLSISDLVTEMRTTERYGRLFDGAGQSGSGMRPSNGSGGSTGRVTKADLKDRTARAKFVDTHGVAAYSALPDK